MVVGDTDNLCFCLECMPVRSASRPHQRLARSIARVGGCHNGHLVCPMVLDFCALGHRFTGAPSGSPQAINNQMITRYFRHASALTCHTDSNLKLSCKVNDIQL